MSSLSWPEVVFLAEAEQEPFADVQVVTLYSYCLEQAQERGCSLTSVESREFVEVFPDRIVIGIDVDKIDDDAILKALNLLTHVDTFTVGDKQEFGPKKSFGYVKLH